MRAVKSSKLSLPPLKLAENKPKHQVYVQTYNSVWRPDIKDENGNVIKKRTCLTVNRKNVGKMANGEKVGFIRFYPEFINDYPELEHYLVFRGKRGKLDFKLIDQLDANKDEDRVYIKEIFDRDEEYSLNLNGKVIKSADGIPMSRDPASLLGLDVSERNNILSSKEHLGKAPEFKTLCSGGAYDLLDTVFTNTGIKKALLQTIKETHPNMAKGAVANACITLLAFIAKMVITGDDSYEGFAAFTRKTLAGVECSGQKTTLLRYVKYINPKFFDTFQRIYIDLYFEKRRERILENGICMHVDGTVIQHKNSDREFVTLGRAKNGLYQNQCVAQVIEDGDDDGLPVMIELFNGNNNDTSTFSNVMQKAACYKVTAHRHTIVADRGYGHKKNMTQLQRNGGYFVFNVTVTKNNEMGKLVDRNMKDLWNGSFVLGTNSDETFTYEDVKYRYDEVPIDVEGKRAQKNGDMTVRYHIFHDFDISNRAGKELRAEISDLVNQVKKGEALSDAQLAKLARVSNFKPDEYKVGQCNPAPEVSFGLLAQAVKYAGIQVLATNDLTLSSLKVREMYDRRSSVETSIQRIKSQLGGRTTNAKTDEGFLQKIFLYHLGNIAKTYLDHKVRHAREKSTGKYSNVFRSTKSVIDEFDKLMVEVYQTGLVWKPITEKHLFMYKSLEVDPPKSVLSCTKNKEMVEVRVSISTDDENE